MTESFPAPDIRTFVVRFWHEWSAGGPRWRGRIEHIPSGRSAAFLDEEGMWQFVQSFGVALDNANQAGTVESQVSGDPGGEENAG
jgi:hypothetical protein